MIECGNLTKITIPEGVTEMDGWIFSGCHNLTAVTLPKSLKTIGCATFEKCNKLTDIYVNKCKNEMFDNTKVPKGCTIHWNSTGPKSI